VDGKEHKTQDKGMPPKIPIQSEEGLKDFQIKG
jgi:hypothetical protein